MTVESQSPNYLIAMKGHPATGKSSLAQALARTFRWPLIDKDDIKDHTLSLADGNRLAYTILWQIVERQLDLGISVIVDTPLSYPADYATACALAKRYAVRLLVVETQLEEGTWRARLEARPAHESTHKIRGWQAMQAQLQRYNDCWRYPIQPEHHLPVDSSRTLTENIHLIEQSILDSLPLWSCSRGQGSSMSTDRNSNNSLQGDYPILNDFVI